MRCRSQFRYQILPKLGSALINRNSMPNHPSRRLRRIRKLAPLHPSILKHRHTIYRVEQSQELNPAHGPAKRLSKCLHESEKFMSFLIVLLRATFPLLPLGKSLPRESHQFLIPWLEQTDVIEHLSEKARGI
jgi:hypothetical protein